MVMTKTRARWRALARRALLPGAIGAVALLLSYSNAFAQAGMGTETERPRADFATAGVTSQPADEGDLVVESSLINRVGDGYIFELPLLARYGIIPDLEGRLGVVLVSAPEDEEVDWGQYISLGAKWRFVQEDVFALAFVPEFQIPAGASDRSLLVPLLLALDVSFTDMIGLTVDGGIVLSDDVGGRLMVGVGAEVVEDWHLALEFAAVSNEVRINEYETAINLWGTHWITDRWLVNAGILKSLTDGDEWSFVLGVTGRFGLGTPNW